MANSTSLDDVELDFKLLQKLLNHVREFSNVLSLESSKEVLGSLEYHIENHISHLKTSDLSDIA